MLGKHVDLLSQIISGINSSLQSNSVAGVKLCQVSMILPDGRGLVLVWDDQAIANIDPTTNQPDGTYTGDWIVQASAT